MSAEPRFDVPDHGTIVLSGISRKCVVSPYSDVVVDTLDDRPESWAA